MAIASTPEIDRICIPQRRIRSNYYSDTYRGQVSLNGKSMLADIQKITVPFPEEKEQAFKAKYNLSDTELIDFYVFFTQAVMNHMKLSQLTSKEGSQITTGCLCYTRFLGAVAEDQQYGVSAYLVSEPCESVIGSDIITKDGVTLKNALLLAARLAQTVKMCNEVDIHLGTVDLNSVYLIQEESYKLIQSGYFLFGGQGRVEPKIYPACAGPFMPDTVLNGIEPVSYKSDVYAVCSFIWTILSGNRYDEKPDLTVPPQYASDGLKAALDKCMADGPSAIDTLLSAIKDELQDVISGNIANAYIDFNEARESADGPNKDDELQEWDDVLALRKESSNGKDRMSKKDFYITIIAAIGVAALLIGLSSVITWAVARNSVERALSQAQQSVTYEVTEADKEKIAENVVELLEERLKQDEDAGDQESNQGPDTTEPEAPIEQEQELADEQIQASEEQPEQEQTEPELQPESEPETKSPDTAEAESSESAEPAPTADENAGSEE